MYTPSEDEPGTAPLAIARGRARALSQLAPRSAEPASGLDGPPANGSNGHHHPAPQVKAPWYKPPWLNLAWLNLAWLKLPWFKLPRLSGPWRRRVILVAWPVGLAAAAVALYLCYL